MSVVGHVESVWRYPVKSMRGEKVASAFVGFAGVYGDRKRNGSGSDSSQATFRSGCPASVQTAFDLAS